MKILTLILSLGFILPLYAMELEHQSAMTLANQADWSCMQFKTLGPCPTPNPPYVGVRIMYWEPNLFIETVKAPGDYIIKETGVLLSSTARTIAHKEVNFFTDNKDIDVSSATSINSINGSALQFNEVHLIDFPFKLFIEGALCPSIGNGSLGLRYLSEADCIQWREGKFEPNLGINIGVWGNLYPRIGFNQHFSSLVSSALTGLRAVSIAGDPVGVHVVTSRVDFMPNVLKDKIQLIYPIKDRCRPLGDNLQDLNQYHDQESRYVWIYWRYRECCRTVSG